MTIGIAELQTPSDGLAAPQYAIADWARGLIYLWGNTPGTVRRYQLILETQEPVASASIANWIFCGDVDPISGALIMQIAPVTVQNADPIAKIDPTALTQTGTFGGSGALLSYPAGIGGGQSLVCIACNGVGYALIKESALSGHVAAIRTDTMTHAGYYGNVVSGSIDSRGIMCRGGSAAYLTWEGDVNGQTATIPIYKITISPGAETYDPSTWPATNPHITNATIGTLAATAVDAGWSGLQANSIGYIETDGNLLLDVSGSGGAASRYIVKVNAATAALMWAVPIGVNGAALDGYNVITGRAAFLPLGEADIITTGSGALSTSALTGLASNASVMSDDVSGLVLLSTSFTEGAGSPVPVIGTPAGFAGFALIGGLLPLPDFPLFGVLKVLLPPAELQFCDAIGAPYAGGTLEFYEQGTSTPKDTWNSPLGGDDHLNPNPLTLDAAGRAILYGDGAYRTVLRDASGNLIWDQPSFTYISACMVPVVGAPDLATARQAMGITDAIEAEAEARAAADSAEELAREAADTALGARIDAETAARIAADNALQAEIDALPAPAPPGNVQGAGAQLDASGYCHVTFPTPFATSCDSFVVTGCATGVWSGAFNVANQTRTGIDVWGSIFGSRTPAAHVVFFWQATGH